LTALAWMRPLPAARRLQIAAIGLPTCGAILWLARNAGPVLRDWAPAAFILVGYYLSGRFFVRPSPIVERWLVEWDRRLIGDPATRFARWPRPLLACLEIIYMGCFLVVPAGFAALAATGRGALADRYWTLVAGAEFGAFVPLSFVQTRPPWALERKAAPPRGVGGTVQRIASRAVRTFTIHANTFPSGHVAGSLAVAFALLGPMPWVGAVFLLLAAGISVACIVGRYHYVIDALAGGALALIIWAIVNAAGP
jgi:membrane-associated phospholipid phosphatase